MRPEYNAEAGPIIPLDQSKVLADLPPDSTECGAARNVKVGCRGIAMKAPQYSHALESDGDANT